MKIPLALLMPFCVFAPVTTLIILPEEVFSYETQKEGVEKGPENVDDFKLEVFCKQNKVSDQIPHPLLLDNDDEINQTKYLEILYEIEEHKYAIFILRMRLGFNEDSEVQHNMQIAQKKLFDLFVNKWQLERDCPNIKKINQSIDYDE